MLLVTGITGYTGKYFMQALIDKKYEGPVCCIVRENSNTSMLDHSGLNIQKAIGDLKDETFLDHCMEGVDSIVHIANIRYTPALIKAAIHHKVKKAVCVHTTGIYSKYRLASEEYTNIENMLKDLIYGCDIKLMILRPTMIYGDMCDRNMSKFIRMIDRFKVFPVIDHGKGLIQPVNARDLGKAYYDVLMLPADKMEPEYILSGDRPIMLLDAFKLISIELGKKRFFISFPLGFGILMASLLKAVSFGKVNYVEKVQRLSEDRCFPHLDATRDFGFVPETFEAGIAREVKEYIKVFKEGQTCEKEY